MHPILFLALEKKDPGVYFPVNSIGSSILIIIMEETKEVDDKH